ncbi:MAG: nucleoside phosphorylase [Candidatus Kuenenia sp.]|nr:nucleoside phosphorylase [Candidatus Kuenenia hertensis]
MTENHAVKWFDESDDSRCVISPVDCLSNWPDDLRKSAKITERLVMFETDAGIPYVKKRFKAQKNAFTLPGFIAKPDVYTVEGKNIISFMQGGFGAPAAVFAFEMAVVLGCKYLFLFGLCGGVGKGLEVGDIVIPTEIVREEGTSYHYTTGETNAFPDKDLLSELKDYLCQTGENTVIYGKTVSTDGVFRQTKTKELSWRKNGIIGVDMEASALLAVAGYHKIPAICMFIVSDKHDLENDSPWKWGGNGFAKKQHKAIDMFVEFARNTTFSNQEL